METYDVFERINDRWPEPGDKLLARGNTYLAEDIEERIYRLGKGYKVAGDRLVQNALQDVTEYRNLVYPIVFCYRHYVELALKALIEEHGPYAGVSLDKKDHGLDSLWNHFMLVAEGYGMADGIGTPAVASCIAELGCIDPSSTAFR